MTSSGENNARDGDQDGLSNVRLPSVLVVDDSRDSANILSSLFGTHGYEVHVAYDWATALETAKAHLPDIILLDLGMPEMDGIHLALLLREDEQLKDKLLVAVTGYADDSTASNARLRASTTFCRSPSPGPTSNLPLIAFGHIDDALRCTVSQVNKRSFAGALSGQKCLGCLS